RAAVDRGEHRAIAAIEEAGLARRLLDAFAGLGVDGGRVHSFLLIIFGSRITAPARTHDDENVTGGHLGLIERTELARCAFEALDVIAPGQPGLAAGHAVRPHLAVAREDRRGHRLEEAHSANRAFAAAPAALAARAAADLEALEPHREAPLQHLGIGEARVGHVGLHHVGAVEARPGARAAGDRLVVLIAVVAEREIVHGPLRGGEHAERAVERVGDALRSLHVARH